MMTTIWLVEFELQPGSHGAMTEVLQELRDNENVKNIRFGVLGNTEGDAIWYLAKVLASGRICEPVNPETAIVRVDVETDEGWTTAFKIFGYEEAFQKLLEPEPAQAQA